MANVVMAAGIDAAGDLDLQFADLSLTFRRAEARRDLLRHRDGARICKRAVVEPGTGNDIGDQSGIGCRQAGNDERPVDRLQISQSHMRQDQVLLVADTDLVEGILLGDVCNSLHLRVGRVPGMPPIGFSEIVTMP